LQRIDGRGYTLRVGSATLRPTNFLIDKRGKISAIAAGCDPRGLVAKNLSAKVAQLVGAKTADVEPAK
jgi:hypothetical protein